MRDKLELDAVWIISAKRLPCSANGNPRYDIIVTDGDVGEWTYRTSSDSMCNFEVQNFASSKCLLDVYVTRSGRVTRLVPVK